ncbi:hypothetical protein RchiOBHm_Chr2g0108601 [Rosa chinensis]|uniref:Uncharacterized protein n=1 Tax=Rosa chinensis TaxID=74649 RepID=A0A2P6RP85_ROSCH|nr:hypothetical protein RchiOBHm_Chr2g0108601 [Rosa chinensis]
MDSKSSTSVCYCGGFPVEVEPKAPMTSTASQNITTSSGTNIPMCKKLDELGGWLVDRVIAAFFGSLQRCSCIHIDTKDDTDHDPIYMPLSNAKNEDTDIEIPIATGM